MFFKRAGWLACLLVLASCRGNRSTIVQRIAVLPFENLSGDISLDWLGRSFSDSISYELSGVRDVVLVPPETMQPYVRMAGAPAPPAPGISTRRSAALLAGATRVVYGTYAKSGSGLSVQAYIEDASTNRQVDAIAVNGMDAISAGQEVARKLSPQARPPATRDLEALRLYHAARGATTADARQQDLQAAIARDPNFSTAYVALFELKLAMRDTAGARAVLADAQRRGNALPESERAFLELQRAQLDNDDAGKQRALELLARLNPSDPTVLLANAQAAQARKDFSRAIALYKQATAVRPDDGQVWNEMAYAYALAGDRNQAIEALLQYQKVAPSDPNPYDSRGDIQLYYGNFREAESSYRQAHDKNPNFLNGIELLRAAMAHLYTGDVKGADGIFEEFAKERTNARDIRIEYMRAEWMWATGRRREAVARMEKFASALSDPRAAGIVSQLWAEAAVWRVALGEREQAVQTIARATVPLAQVQLARLLVQPSAGTGEWSKRADQLFPKDARLKRLALANALLFDRKFSEAVPVVETLLKEEPPATRSVFSVMLAWCYRETGRQSEMKVLLEHFPTPEPQGFGSLGVIWFPRIFELRGEMDKFRALSGSDKLIW